MGWLGEALKLAAGVGVMVWFLRWRRRFIKRLLG